ncbi:uncharacterized protein [Macaca fascicularis]|uniref:uncharacterized protein n=1 Tax=Macaca fascicularis TaxID=9541 RepID=UPI003D15CCDC
MGVPTASNKLRGTQDFVFIQVHLQRTQNNICSADLLIMAAAGRGSRAVRRVRALSLPSPSSAAAAAAEAAALAIAAVPYRAISSYFSPGAAATRRPPAGRPARPAAGTLPPPAPGLGPRRIRPASGGGPRPGPAKPPPRGCAGRTRPQASWRAREGGAALPRAPGFRPPSPPGALGAAASSPPWNPGPGLPAAREREARESAPGPGAGGGRAARDRSRGSLLAPSALPGSRPRAGGAAGPGWGAGAAVSCGRGGWLFGRPPKLPSCRVVWACYPVPGPELYTEKVHKGYLFNECGMLTFKQDKTWCL